MAEKKKSQQYRKAERAFQLAPVPQAPAAVLDAAYWMFCRADVMIRHAIKGRRRNGIFKRMATRLKIPMETVSAIFDVHRTFRGKRGWLPHRAACNLHPHYELWWHAYRASVVRYAVQWHDKGRLPRTEKGVQGEDFKWDKCAARLRLSVTTVMAWVDAWEDRKFSIEKPEILTKKGSDRMQRRLRTEFRGKEQDLVNATRALNASKARMKKVEAAMASSDPSNPELESHARGVKGSAKDVAMIPRKRAFQSTRGVSAYIEGGRLVIESAFEPHVGQSAFLSSGARFRFVVAGIRGGKTRAGAVELIRHAISMPGAHGWVVGPTYTMLDNARRAVLGDTLLKHRKDLLKPGGYVKREGGGGRLHFSNGTVVDFRSAEWEDTLRGPGIDFMWIDEAQLLKESAWNICKGRTSDTLGRIWCTGTPLGRNWLFREFSRGADKIESDYASWRFPSTMNPMVSASEVEMMRRQIPESFWRQEYLAEFVEGVSSVFGELDPCLVDKYPIFDERSLPRVAIGLDLARKHDFSAIVVLSSHGQVCHSERFTKVGWKWQRERVIELSHAWSNAPVIADATGVGDPFIEDLTSAGIDVHPYNMGHHTKKSQLVEQLMLDIEGARMWLPKEAERLLYELQIYRRSLTTAGNVRYSAPDGEHDDMVIALALANWGVRRMGLATAPVVASVAPQDEIGPRAPESARNGLWGRQTAVTWGSSGLAQRRPRLFGSN